MKTCSMGDFLSVCLSSIHLFPPLGHPARSEAQPPGLKPEAWLAVWASGFAVWDSDVAGWALGLAGWASDLGDWASDVAG